MCVCRSTLAHVGRRNGTDVEGELGGIDRGGDGIGGCCVWCDVGGAA